MHTTIKISSDLNRVIMLRSHHQRNKPRVRTSTAKKRSEAIYGTKSYRDAVQRAFNKAKEQIYFNPDMKHFITLTYKGVDHTPEQVLHDVKMLVKKQNYHNRQLGAGRPIKYIFVMEYQDRGSIHVHMIANDSFSLQVNSNGYRELRHWAKGFSSVLTIKDMDDNFRPYLYLFKYMRKAQRIGKSFLHSSRNLNNYTPLEDATINLAHWRTLTQEATHTTVNNTNFFYYRNFLQFDDTINSQSISDLSKGDITTWHEQVKLHSNKALERILANLTQPSI